MAVTIPGKPVPVPTPETQPFWDGCAAGELRIQRCTDCSTAFFYPRPVCPACGSVNVEWFTASGRATLYSYVINHRPAPGFEDDGPYAIAVVQLAEGPRMMTSLIGVPGHARGPGPGHAVAGDVRAARRGVPARVHPRRGRPVSGGPGVIIAGAAETDQVGKLPGHSTLGLHVEAAVNAVRDAGLSLRDIDGIATVSAPGPAQVAHALGIVPRWIDGTGVGGTSFLLHVRHAAAAIQAGYARTVLVTHGESGRSRVGAAPFRGPLSSPGGQFEAPYGTFGPTTTFTITALRYMKDFGLTHEQLAYVAVAQRRWAAKNPRAAYRDPITVEDVLASRLIAYPFHLLECCLVTDGGGALVVTSDSRAGEFPKPAVYVLGTGESAEAPMISQLVDFTESQAFRLAGQAAFAEAGIGVGDVRHLMIYDAFAHVPIYGLEALGFVGKGEAGAFIADGNTEPGGRLPLNTNGGGLSYTHTGMYGMFAITEAVRQVRGEAAAQVEAPDISVVLGNGGAFATAGVLVLGRQPR